MRLWEERILRKFIHKVLEEDGWEDPQAVYAKQQTLVDDPDDDEDIDEEKYSSTNPSKAVHGHDNYANANTSIASMKPIAPTKSSGGAGSGRNPGGKVASSSGRVYSAGY